MLGGLDPHTTHHLRINMSEETPKERPIIISTSNVYRPKVTPVVGKFYYIDYVDKEIATGSFEGIAECVKIHTENAAGKPINPPMYEFVHMDPLYKSRGKQRMIRSLFLEEEIIMEARP